MGAALHSARPTHLLVPHDLTVLHEGEVEALVHVLLEALRQALFERARPWLDLENLAWSASHVMPWLSGAVKTIPDMTSRTLMFCSKHQRFPPQDKRLIMYRPHSHHIQSQANKCP